MPGPDNLNFTLLMNLGSFPTLVSFTLYTVPKDQQPNLDQKPAIR